MLRLQDVHCAYGPVAAVRGISLEVPDSSLVCILGANGAGKSTTLKAIAGLVRPVSGQIFYGNHEITRLAAPRRVSSGISLAPEGRHIFTEFTVEQNLIVGGHTLSRRELAQRLAHAFDLFPHLQERRKQMAGSLSGGEQQMLAIGRALMTRPGLLLLDEPSLGLAPIIVQQLFAMISEIRSQGTTVLLVEQNARMALKIADYAYVLSNGRVTISGTAQEMATSGEIERSYLGS